jgi:hypothetical protein
MSSVAAGCFFRTVTMSAICTRHTSYVTRHTSHVTRHTSHVTHQTFQVSVPPNRLAHRPPLPTPARSKSAGISIGCCCNCARARSTSPTLSSSTLIRFLVHFRPARTLRCCSALPSPLPGTGGIDVLWWPLLVRAAQSSHKHDTFHVPRHMSHVTRHTSHVTRHTSHVTRHTSHVSRHTSHVTRHTSHMTHDTSHVTYRSLYVICSTSNVTRHASHVTRHTSLVTRHAPSASHLICHSGATAWLVLFSSEWSRLPQPPFLPENLNPVSFLHAQGFLITNHSAYGRAEFAVVWLWQVAIIARHTSHVARHTSHVTPYSSLLTRHTSHVTCHMPHVTLHTSLLQRACLYGLPLFSSSSLLPSLFFALPLLLLSLFRRLRCRPKCTICKIVVQGQIGPPVAAAAASAPPSTAQPSTIAASFTRGTRSLFSSSSSSSSSSSVDETCDCR